MENELTKQPHENEVTKTEPNVKILNRTKQEEEPELHEHHDHDGFCSTDECLNLLKEHPLYPAAVSLCQWRDPTRSGLVFMTLNLFFYLITCGGYTFLSLSFYVFFFLLIISIGFTIFQSKVKGVPNALEERFKNTNFSISKEFVDAHNHVVHVLFEGFRVYARELLLCKKMGRSVKAVFASYFLSALFGWFNLITLIWVGTIIAFASPRVYEMKKKEIDEGLKLGNEMSKHYYGMAMEKASQLPVLSSLVGKGKSE